MFTTRTIKGTIFNRTKENLNYDKNTVDHGSLEYNEQSILPGKYVTFFAHS